MYSAFGVDHGDWVENAGQQRGFASNDVLNRKPDFM